MVLGNLVSSTSCYTFDYYKIRAQGIEFSTTTLLADIASQMIHLNGNLPQLLGEFMATVMPHADYRDGHQLLASFNRGKKPSYTLETFKAASNGKAFFSQGGQVEVSWKHDQLRINVIEPSYK